MMKSLFLSYELLEKLQSNFKPINIFITEE